MLDVNNPADKAIADAVTTWLSAKDAAATTGRGRGASASCTSSGTTRRKSYRDINTWTTYTGSVPHTDHVHFSFAWDGACKRTSWWIQAGPDGPLTSRRAAPPARHRRHGVHQAQDVVLALGATGDAVKVAQSNLPGVVVDGDFRAADARRGQNLPDDARSQGHRPRHSRAVWNTMEQLQYPLIKYRKTVIPQEARRACGQGRGGPFNSRRTGSSAM